MAKAFFDPLSPRAPDLQRGALPRWAATEDRLNVADGAVSVMRTARSQPQFERGWSDFVDALEQAWARLYVEGKAASTKFQPWAGPVDALRKDDPLLRYLVEARHQSQHGILGLTYEEPTLQLGGPGSVLIKSLHIAPDGQIMADYDPASPDSSLVIEHLPGRLRLGTLRNRKTKLTFNPPETHLGIHLRDLSPVAVALTGLAYYRDILAAAKNKFP